LAPHRRDVALNLAAGKPAAKRPQRCLCGHFAVIEPIEQQRSKANGIHEAQRFREFSPVFADFRGLAENRGDRI
jgi:hypothetical protein